MRGVRVPLVGVVAPAVADDYHLTANWRGVRWFDLDDGGLENQRSWGKEFTDEVGDDESFPFSLSGVLEAEIVHLGCCKGEYDVGDAFL